MIEFTYVGLDIRVASVDHSLSADATVWEQEEQLYERAQSELNIEENSFQLLHPQNSAQMSRLVELVESAPHAVLVSLELPRKVFDVCQQAAGFASSINLKDHEWHLVGFDVCDINGFFSFLDMEASATNPLILFDEEHLIDAFVMAQAANFVIQEHSPFVVVGLKRYVLLEKK